MTAQPQPPEETPDRPLSAYEVGLAALTAAAIAETARIWDHWVPGLVEEVPRRARALLVATLARSWAAHAHRARVVAALTGSAITGRPPLPLPEPETPRLIEAAETLLDRAEALQVGLDDGAEEPLTYATFEDEVQQLQAQRLRAAMADLAERERLAREVEAIARQQAGEEQAEAAETARLEAEDAAQEAEEHRRRAEQQRAEDEEFMAAKRREVLARLQEQEEAREHARREERRRAQLARAQNVARSETTAAAAETLPQTLADDPRFPGWVRKVNEGACERCRGWWLSGGEPGAASPVRPWSVRMKRHNGCTCTQRPVPQEEADVRGRTDEPEPRLRNKPTGRGGARGDDAGGGGA